MRCAKVTFEVLVTLPEDAPVHRFAEIAHQRVVTGGLNCLVAAADPDFGTTTGPQENVWIEKRAGS
jgi:hypothetical protein